MTKEKLKGIGGWLLIPTISFILAGIIFLYYSVIFLIEMGLYGDYISVYGFMIYGAVAFLYIYTLILEFKHKEEYPKLAIITLWATPILLYIFIFLFNLFENLGDEVLTIFFILIGNVIWTAYFRKSKRVKNTFVK